jgi:putative tryptophan/tyrosine transport system substrate-binding protein
MRPSCLVFAGIGCLLALACSGLWAQAPVMSTVCMLAPSPVSVDFSRQFTLPELARQGFREGENMRFIVREAGGKPAELPRLAAELATQRCDVVVAVAPSSIAAARQAMPATPIVMGFGDDPVGRGWAATLQRPGGFITGVSMQASEADLKRLELMRDLLPGLRRLGVLLVPTVTSAQRRALQETAERLGFVYVAMEAARAEDFERAVATFRQARVEAVLVTASPIYLASVSELVRLTQAGGWPTVCEWQEMARAGCVASFGPVIGELRTRVGAVVAQVLRGVRPADIPIEQPTRFELTLNLKTARSLGVTVPQTLLLRADEVIE